MRHLLKPLRWPLKAVDLLQKLCFDDYKNYALTEMNLESFSMLTVPAVSQ